MGSECIGEESYTVNIKSKDRVLSLLPMQEHILQLSNLDLLLPPLDFGVFLCYKKDLIITHDFDTRVSDLKASLAKVLVTYYPFAGEVVNNVNGEPEILCNNRGVDVIVAKANVEMEKLNFYDPDESVEKKLMPEKKAGVMCVQVTELKCGGIVIACTFDHRVSDAYSANMFLVSWAETTTKKPMTVIPSFNKSMFTPQKQLHHNTILDRLYIPYSSIKIKDGANNKHANDTGINRIYHVKSEDIDQMQVETSTNGKRRSKIEAFSAFLWRIIAKGARKRNEEDCNVCRMGIVVNGRCRFPQEYAMDNYFGNVLSIPYGTMSIDDLEQNKLKETAESVHGFLKEAMKAEHFMDLVDWVEARRPEPAAARIYLNGGEGEDNGVAFVVSSGRGFPIGELEFGWGKAVFGSYHFPWGGCAGYVMPMPSVKGDGDWIVYMHLMEDLIRVLEEEAGHVFRRLSSDYVMSGPVLGEVELDKCA